MEKISIHSIQDCYQKLITRKDFLKILMVLNFSITMAVVAIRGTIGEHVFSKGRVGLTVKLSDMQGDTAVIIVNFYHPVVIKDLYLFTHIQKVRCNTKSLPAVVHDNCAVRLAWLLFLGQKVRMAMPLAGIVPAVHKNTTGCTLYSYRACY